MKVHFRNIRLRVNAGMDFPECYAHADLLDTDKGRLKTTGNRNEVTCKRCLARLDKPGGTNASS